MVVVLVVQIALGGWTSSNYAALACPDLPTCQNQWFPQADFYQGFDFFQTIGPNYLGGLLESEARIAIHFSHRLGALVVSILVLTLAFTLWRLGLTTSKRWSILLLIVLALQVGLGMSCRTVVVARTQGACKHCSTEKRVCGVLKCYRLASMRGHSRQLTGLPCCGANHGGVSSHKRHWN